MIIGFVPPKTRFLTSLYFYAPVNVKFPKTLIPNGFHTFRHSCSCTGLLPSWTFLAFYAFLQLLLELQPCLCFKRRLLQLLLELQSCLCFKPRLLENLCLPQTDPARAEQRFLWYMYVWTCACEPLWGLTYPNLVAIRLYRGSTRKQLDRSH